MEGASRQLRDTLAAPPPGWRPPPGAGPPSPVAVRHAALEHLRDAGDPQYLLLRTLLEVLHGRGFLRDPRAKDAAVAAGASLSGEEEELLFHCAAGVRHVTLRRWDACRPSFRSSLRDFLLAVGLGILPGIAADDNRRHLPRTVAMACLNGAASFWKRGWTEPPRQPEDGSSVPAMQEDPQAYLESLLQNLLPGMQRFPHHKDSEGGMGASQELLFGYLDSLLAAPFQPPAPTATQQQQQQQHSATMAASFLSLLVGEFGGSGGGYHLPAEYHRACHRVFENGPENGDPGSSRSGLDAALHVVMTALSSLVGHILGDVAALRAAALPGLGFAVVDVTCVVLSWEFGAGRRHHPGGGPPATVLRPPRRWREALVNPSFLQAVFRAYAAARAGRDAADGPAGAARGRLAHRLRQLLLQLSSVAGDEVFADEPEREAYAGFLLDGCVHQLQLVLEERERPAPAWALELWQAEVVDLVAILSRLATNFRVRVLSRLPSPSFPQFLAVLAAVGTWLLDSTLGECRRVGGDVESMDADWIDEAVAQILQCSDALADDYWLLSNCDSGGSGEETTVARRASRELATVLAPLYGPYVACRVGMASLEERHAARAGAELDEVREEIAEAGLTEEMASAAALGRLHALTSLATLGDMFRRCVPQLLALFAGAGTGGREAPDPDTAAVLEEARMLLLCAGHLLTDECAGETPAPPAAVARACQPGDSGEGAACAAAIAGLIDTLRSIAEAQARAAAARPADPCLSPLLAQTLLWFFGRFCAAYVLPPDSELCEAPNTAPYYSTPQTAQPLVSFCATLSLLYFCHWPQERELQGESTSLLLALARKGPFVRSLLVASPSFERIAALHSVCAALRHNASTLEIGAAMAAVGGELSMDDVRGYMRLPYTDRARILTCLVVGCSDMQDAKATSMLSGCMKAVEAPFSALVHALGYVPHTSLLINCYCTGNKHSKTFSMYLFYV